MLLGNCRASADAIWQFITAIRIDFAQFSKTYPEHEQAFNILASNLANVGADASDLEYQLRDVLSYINNEYLDLVPRWLTKPGGEPIQNQIDIDQLRMDMASDPMNRSQKNLNAPHQVNWASYAQQQQYHQNMSSTFGYSARDTIDIDGTCDNTSLGQGFALPETQISFLQVNEASVVGQQQPLCNDEPYVPNHTGPIDCAPGVSSPWVSEGPELMLQQPVTSPYFSSAAREYNSTTSPKQLSDFSHSQPFTPQAQNQHRGPLPQTRANSSRRPREAFSPGQLAFNHIHFQFNEQVCEGSQIADDDKHQSAWSAKRFLTKRQMSRKQSQETYDRVLSPIRRSIRGGSGYKVEKLQRRSLQWTMQQQRESLLKTLTTSLSAFVPEADSEEDDEADEHGVGVTTAVNDNVDENQPDGHEQFHSSALSTPIEFASSRRTGFAIPAPGSMASLLGPGDGLPLDYNSNPPSERGMDGKSPR